MAADAAKTVTSGTSSAAIRNRYYNELFLDRAESKLIWKQLGQLNNKIAQGQGGYGTGVVYWTRFTNLPLVTAGQGEGVPTTAVQLTASNVTGTVAQYDAAVSLSDLMAYTSMGDIRKQAMELLAYNAGISIDTVIRNTVSTSGTIQNATGVAGAAWTSIPVTGTLTVAEIKKAVRTLRRNDAMEVDGGFYASPIHPDALFDLMTDTTVGSWIEANKYDSATSDKLFKGEVGKLAGVRFLESSSGYIRNTGVTSSSSIYVTSVFGRGAFGVTELQDLRTYVKGFESGGTADPTEKVSTMGWKTAFGVASLNSNNYVNIHHTVSSTA